MPSLLGDFWDVVKVFNVSVCCKLCPTNVNKNKNPLYLYGVWCDAERQMLVVTFTPVNLKRSYQLHTRPQ